ncbi:ATP-binding protein [Nonomuraea endophytica]|uniref:ATP-binding protein n=1 Tax=Nonomuraea endophytica TaxID=714136 RepID=UPI0037C65EC7
MRFDSSGAPSEPAFDRLLQPQETVLAIFAVSLFRPRITHLVVTTARVLGVDRAADRPSVQIPLAEVVAVEIRDNGFGRPNAVLIRPSTAPPADFGDAAIRDRGQIRRTILNAKKMATNASTLDNEAHSRPFASETWVSPAAPVRVAQYPSELTPHMAIKDEERPLSRSTWREQVPTSGAIELPPDPRALDGLGRNHSLETAIADLVDNSIDAGASHVLIRLVRVGARLRALYVVDNGHGMPESKIDAAMTIGGKRTYQSTDLGKFGLGLKAASFSQARSLTVISKAFGSSAVGRRWLLDGDRSGFHCDVIPTEFATDEFERNWGIDEISTGTVIRWDDVSGFPSTDDPDRVEDFISRTASAIRNHLGLVFHRILQAGRIVIEIDVEDIDADMPGGRIPVEAINPFGYSRAGRAGYPKELTARFGDVNLTFTCHIWPGRSTSHQFKLAGGHEDRQGIYFYRRNRLLQAGGGWHGIHSTNRRLQLARVEVEIDDDIVRMFAMNPEKSKVNVGPEFTQLAENAKAEDGTSFHDYLNAAEETFRQSGKRNTGRRKMAPLGKGMAPELRKAIEREIPIDEDAEPIDLRWKRFTNHDFFEIDRDQRVLWLNETYRPESKGERRSLNDAPLLKALLFIVTEELFRGEYLGPRDKDNIELYQQILTTAALSELR